MLSSHLIYTRLNNNNSNDESISLPWNILGLKLIVYSSEVDASTPIV